MGRSIRTAALVVWLALLLTVPALGAEPDSLVPVGRTVGLELEMDGVYIVGFGEEEGSPARAAGLREGDRICTVNGQPLETAEALRDLVNQTGGGVVVLDVERAGRAVQVAVQPVDRNGSLFLGLRVRDKINGLGTVTFYDPETQLFGALGHGVSGGGGQPLVIRGGLATDTSVSGIRRGAAGNPGSLLGPTSGGETLGLLEQNTERGLFGHAAGSALEGQAVPLAAREEVRTGPAEIWCSIDGDETQRYAVEIEAVRLDTDHCRDLRLVVTDPRLLEKTGGIVQGMSGSPILQNGKLVGAVTHVLVRDPARGYGILIGHMLEGANQAAKAA